MVQPVALDEAVHRSFKINPQRGRAYGDNQVWVPVALREFRQAALCFPIVLRKNADAKHFEFVVLLGLQPGENLCASEDAWLESYMPLAIQAHPLMIGPTGDTAAAPLQLLVDTASPRLGQHQGEALFLPGGQATPYLERLHEQLLEWQQGRQQANRFVDLLVAEGLLEALPAHTAPALGDFYTISESVLRNLNTEQLMRLFRQHYLELIYLAMASLGHLDKLRARQRELVGRN